MFMEQFVDMAMHNFVISGRDAVDWQTYWCSIDENMIYIENNDLFNKEADNSYITYVPESDENEIVVLNNHRFACWQKALADMIAFPYYDSSPIIECYLQMKYMEQEKAVEWVEWIDTHPQYYDYIDKRNPFGKYVDKIKTVAREYLADPEGYKAEKKAIAEDAYKKGIYLND